VTYYHESRTLWIPKTRSGGNRAPVTFCNVQQNVWRSLVFRAAVLWDIVFDSRRAWSGFPHCRLPQRSNSLLQGH